MCKWILGMGFWISTSVAAAQSYPWLEGPPTGDSLGARLAAPKGFRRVEVQPGSFAEWLRGLPLKPGQPPVLLFDGSPKGNQSAHIAVVDIDVGKRDLQQCADAVMRLRAEYLFSVGRVNDIHFNFTSGDKADFKRWSQGFRPVVRGNQVRWSQSAAADASHLSLRKYLDKVFEFAGSASLSRELKPVSRIEPVQIGDVFIQGGFPGHAVLVVDRAESDRGGEAFLLVQSYMPAQQIQVLHNPAGAPMDPWFDGRLGDKLVTPEWTFDSQQRKRFE